MSSTKRNVYVVTHKGAPVKVATSKKRAYELMAEMVKKEFGIIRFDNEQLNK